MSKPIPAEYQPVRNRLNKLTTYRQSKLTKPAEVREKEPEARRICKPIGHPRHRRWLASSRPVRPERSFVRCALLKYYKLARLKSYFPTAANRKALIAKMCLMTGCSQRRTECIKLDRLERYFICCILSQLARLKDYLLTAANRRNPLLFRQARPKRHYSVHYSTSPTEKARCIFSSCTDYVQQGLRRPVQQDRRQHSTLSNDIAGWKGPEVIE